MNMTYRELDRKSDILASHMQILGVHTNTSLGILVDKTFSMMVSILGILKSGGAYVPMDPGFPESRIKYMVEDSGVTMLVTEMCYKELMDSIDYTDTIKKRVYVDAHIVTTGNGDDDGCNGPNTNVINLVREVRPSNIGYLIYTSGTTGKPKGCMCNHKGAVEMIQLDWYKEHGQVGIDVVGLCLNYVFDASIQTIFSTLGSGLTLSMDTKNCTMVECTPSMASFLLDDDTNNIHSIIVGGEACPHGLEAKFKNFLNVYGPTECSIWATKSFSSDTIGKPLPNVLCYVVHPDDGTLCLPGASGELWIGGIGVTRGYWNQPELTAEKFVNNPFRRESIVYKTGDRVKWNSNGELIFLGRFDHQVKIRGYRIELGEIETALEKQDGVTGAIVLAHKDKLVAFVTVTSSYSLLLVGDKAQEKEEESISADTDEATIKADLVEQTILPEYMMPWRVVCMDKFPLTHNNKVNRSELPLPDANCFAELSYDSPTTETEFFLSGVFSDLLNVGLVGIHSSFFYLGGHSILVMECVNLIRNKFGVTSFSIRDFMSLETVQKIGSLVDIMKAGSGAEINASNIQINDEDEDLLMSEEKMLH